MYKTLAVNSFNVQTPRPVTIELRPFFQVRMRRKHVVDVQRWPTSPYDLCCACAESIYMLDVLRWPTSIVRLVLRAHRVVFALTATDGCRALLSMSTEHFIFIRIHLRGREKHLVEAMYVGCCESSNCLLAT